MLELDIPLQSSTSFSQGGGLYRCRTFPGLKDLVLQEDDGNHSNNLQVRTHSHDNQGQDDEDEEGYWSSIQDTDTSQTHEGSVPSPGLLMSSFSSWESWKGSSDLWLEDGVGGGGGGGGDRDSLNSTSSPGILLSSEDLWKNNREAEDKNKCWMEGISKLSKASTYNCLNSGGRWREDQEAPHGDTDTDSEGEGDEEEEDISLHCYILPSASRSSFYFVKRSLEVIPEEKEEEEEESEETTEEPVENNAHVENEYHNQETTDTTPETIHNATEDKDSKSETEKTFDSRGHETETVVSKSNMRSIEFEDVGSKTEELSGSESGTAVVKYSEKQHNNLSLLEELSHQDINDMYCVLSYMPDSGSECRLYEHTFRMGASPPYCDSAVAGGVVRPSGGKNSNMILGDKNGNNPTGTKRRQSNPLGSPFPSGANSFRPRCAKVYPAESDDTTFLNAWVYQDNLKEEKSPDAYTIEKQQQVGDNKITNKTHKMICKQIGKNKHNISSRNSSRKHNKRTRGYSFLHRIWKSFRRKMLITDQV